VLWRSDRRNRIATDRLMLASRGTKAGRLRRRFGKKKKFRG
jgi:hypothetical protein